MGMRRASIFCALGRIATAGPNHDQVRPQRHEALEIDRGHVSDARHLARRRRLIGVLDRRHDFAAGAGGEQHLGGARRQAHDAQRRLAHADLAAEVVHHGARTGRRARHSSASAHSRLLRKLDLSRVMPPILKPKVARIMNYASAYAPRTDKHAGGNRHAAGRPGAARPAVTFRRQAEGAPPRRAPIIRKCPYKVLPPSGAAHVPACHRPASGTLQRHARRPAHLPRRCAPQRPL